MKDDILNHSLTEQNSTQSSKRSITYIQAINEALDIALAKDGNVICYGLGVDDPRGVFGTTLGLQEKYGSHRVFDMPTSENAMTGVAIGASLDGIRPVMTHQRLDFFLLAMDQLVNNAAKWHYTFGGKLSVPITIRLILGRGWGQGPTHSQNLQAWFAHIPGLKVVMPTTAADAKGLLLSSIFDDNPVIFLEHRWVHDQVGDVPKGDYRIPFGQAHKLQNGNDITIISMSYLTIEALHAAEYLNDHGIHCEIIDLCSIKPLDMNTIYNSIAKTGRLLVLDSGVATCSISSEIIAQISIEKFDLLKCAPERLSMPDIPEPTSFALTKDFYIYANNIVIKVMKMLDYECVKSLEKIPIPVSHDVPGDWFQGPF